MNQNNKYTRGYFFPQVLLLGALLGLLWGCPIGPLSNDYHQITVTNPYPYYGHITVNNSRVSDVFDHQYGQPNSLELKFIVNSSVRGEFGGFSTSGIYVSGSRTSPVSPFQDYPVSINIVTGADTRKVVARWNFEEFVSLGWVTEDQLILGKKVGFKWKIYRALFNTLGNPPTVLPLWEGFGWGYTSYFTFWVEQGNRWALVFDAKTDTFQWIDLASQPVTIKNYSFPDSDQNTLALFRSGSDSLLELKEHRTSHQIVLQRINLNTQELEAIQPAVSFSENYTYTFRVNTAQQRIYFWGHPQSYSADSPSQNEWFYVDMQTWSQVNLSLSDAARDALYLSPNSLTQPQELDFLNLASPDGVRWIFTDWKVDTLNLIRVDLDTTGPIVQTSARQLGAVSWNSNYLETKVLDFNKVYLNYPMFISNSFESYFDRTFFEIDMANDTWTPVEYLDYSQKTTVYTKFRSDSPFRGFQLVYRDESLPVTDSPGGRWKLETTWDRLNRDLELVGPSPSTTPMVLTNPQAGLIP